MEGYYSYKVIKEDFYTGERTGRVRRYDGFKPLEIGGLYVHLGKGFPGAYEKVGGRMTRDEAKKVVMIIDAVYPNWNPEDLTFTVNAWATMLKDYAYADIEQALRTYISTDTKGFAPSIGQLINSLYAADRLAEIPEMEAWNMVSKAISNGIYNSAEEFQKLPEPVRKAVGSAQNIRQWAMMDSETVQSVVQSSFLRAYKSVRERADECRKLPNDVKKIIMNTETKMIQTGNT